VIAAASEIFILILAKSVTLWYNESINIGGERIMLKKIIRRAIAFVLTALTLFSCVSCNIDDTTSLGNPNYIQLSEKTAPKLTVSEPKCDPAIDKYGNNSELYSQCRVNISANGRKGDNLHWTYLDAFVTVSMMFGGKSYDIEVDLGEMGIIDNREYTVKFKTPISESEILSGYEEVSARKYSGYVLKDGEVHDFSQKSADREILTANKGDPCNEYTYTEDTCQKCRYYKIWGETPPAGHDIGANGICTRCGKTSAEINADSTETTAESKEPSSEAETEGKLYLDIKHWAGNSSVACKPSSLGEEDVARFYVNDVSLINYIVIESSNELVAKPKTARYPEDENGLVEIPYTIESYGEAVITVYINHKGEEGSTKLTLKLTVSELAE